MSTNLQDNPQVSTVDNISDYFGPRPVAWVRVLGSNWGNENKGGFIFALNPNPANIEYFIVRPMDVGLELFLSLALAARANSLRLEVEYRKTNLTESGKYEGDVVAITVK
jgi:hypothetical protein